MKKIICVFFPILLVFGFFTFFSSCDMFVKPEQTPVSGDYTIGNTNQTAGSVTAVTITPKSGKSTGAVSNIKYADSATPPQAVGTYAVTFDVAAAIGWNAASGLSAGNLVVGTGDNKTPVASDYIFGKLGQTAGSVTAVLITPKSEKSSGARTIHYEGSGGTTYAKSTNIPHPEGTYAVTFDVAAAAGWNAATGLSAGTLTIYAATGNERTPVASDYTIGNLGQTAGNVTAVTITAKSGSNYSPGLIRNIRYAGSDATPQTAGTFAVTFDVDAASGWKMAAGLSAGNLTVSAVGDTSQTPVRGDYTIGNLEQSNQGPLAAVSIEPIVGKSPGAITIYYQGIDGTSYAKSETFPSGAGTYIVTFDVAAVSPNWKEAKGLLAGYLTITGGVQLNYPRESHYTIGNLEQTAGSTITAVTVTRKDNNNSNSSPGAITVYYAKIESQDERTQSLPSTAGTYLVTFDVAQAANWEARTRLEAGILRINPAGAATESGDFSAAVTDTNATITKYNGTSTTVTIPGTIDGKPVTAIGDFLFYDITSGEGKKVSSVTFDSPSSITSIGVGAFYGNRLTNVSIPSGVTTIGAYAFSGNRLTGSISIPSGVTTIEMRAFSDNYLTGVSIPNGVTTIGAGAFSDNELTSVTIPNSVTTIGSSAFSDNELTTVTIPNTVTKIEASAFSWNELTSVTFPTNNAFTSIGEFAFSGNKLASVNIPSSVTKIEGGAFDGNPLTSVTIGANVTLDTVVYGETFPGNMVTVYNNGGKLAGTYTRNATTNVWSKQ